MGAAAKRDDTAGTGGATGARPRTRLSPERRQKEILDAATDSFRTLDYSAVSLGAVARRAGVTRGLLHHYFGSKRDLYLAVIEREVRIPESMAIVPRDSTGELSEVVAVCVDRWLTLIEAAGGLWSGAAGSGGIADGDVDAILTRARDDLVERMISEVPFPADLDPSLLRVALRCFAASARVAAHEWLVARTLTRAQTAALLRTSLLALAQMSVPAMDETDG